jgi:Protein of unknown function (DUF3617)
MTIARKPGPGALRLAASAILALGAAGAASASDGPTLRPGLWKFERTMESAGAEPQKVETTRCVDPILDQKEQVEMLTKAGCKFEPVVQEGNSWRRKASCKMGNVTSTSDSVMTASGPDAYTVTVEGMMNGQKGHEVLHARRIGDCPK